MSARYLLAAAAAALLAAPAVAAEKPKPTVVVQFQPTGKVLADVRELIRLASGPGEAEAALKEFQKGLEDTLGEKGFEGLDLNRPVAVYVTVKEKFADSSIVVVAPYTTEKEFLGLLERAKLKPEEVPGKKGLYKLAPPTEGPDRPIFEHDSYVRFADGWAHVGFNGEDVVDPANLIPTAELVDPRQSAQVVARLYPDRFPEKLLKTWLADFENSVNGVKGFLLPDQKHVAKGLSTIIDEALKLIRRQAEGVQKDGREVSLRYAFDPATGDQSFELTVTPKPGTDLAKAVAARTPTTNRFAGVVGQDAVLGMTGQLPAFAPEVREMVAAGFEILQGEAEGDETLPEPLRLAAAEAFKGLARTARKGDGDFAAALVGPGKDGAFTAVAAVAFDDPGAVEKALRAAVEKNPLLKKAVTPDADRAGGVSLHTVAVGEFLDADARKVFGKDAVVCVAFGKDAVYAALGPSAAATAAVKSALAAKPAPAPAAAWVGNPAGLAKLATAVGGEKQGKLVGEFLGKDDRLLPFVTVTVEGGERLTYRHAENVRFDPFRLLGYGETAGGAFEPVPNK